MYVFLIWHELLKEIYCNLSFERGLSRLRANRIIASVFELPSSFMLVLSYFLQYRISVDPYSSYSHPVRYTLSVKKIL